MASPIWNLWFQIMISWWFFNGRVDPTQSLKSERRDRKMTPNLAFFQRPNMFLMSNIKECLPQINGCNKKHNFYANAAMMQSLIYMNRNLSERSKKLDTFECPPLVFIVISAHYPRQIYSNIPKILLWVWIFG